MRRLRGRLWPSLAGALALAAWDPASGVDIMTEPETIFYVDPGCANDEGNDGLSEAAPFCSVDRAIAEGLGPGDRLRLRAGVHRPIAFPSSLAGSEAAPIVVEPYAGTTVVFDGRIRQPDLAQVGNGAWEPAPGGPSVNGGPATSWTNPRGGSFTDSSSSRSAASSPIQRSKTCVQTTSRSFAPGFR